MKRKTVGNNVHIQNISDLEMRITSGDDKQKAETTKLRIRLFWNPLNDNWSYSIFMRSIIPVELEMFKSPRRSSCLTIRFFGVADNFKTPN